MVRRLTKKQLMAIHGKEKNSLLTERVRLQVPNQENLSAERIKFEREKIFAANHPDILIINRGSHFPDMFRRV